MKNSQHQHRRKQRQQQQFPQLSFMTIVFFGLLSLLSFPLLFCSAFMIVEKRHSIQQQKQQQHHQQFFPLSSTASSSSSSKPTTPPSIDNMDPASELLYKEQEKLLISQGEREALLMKDTWTPLEAHVVRGAGSGGGGFGASGGSGKSTTSLKAQAKAHAQELKEQGVVRIDNILPQSMVDEIRTKVYKMKQQNTNIVQQGLVPSIELFANVLLKNNRYDMTIPLGKQEGQEKEKLDIYGYIGNDDNDNNNNDDWVVKALYEIFMNSPVGMTISNLLTPQAVLYEFSTLISDPGSERQVIHPDTPQYLPSDGTEPVLYTCFIALQDITLEMGPTIWIPKTHTADMHKVFKDETEYTNNNNNNNGDNTVVIPKNPKEELLHTMPSKLGLLPKGCCAIYDSRVLHAGGANIDFSNGDRSRALMYFSFKNPTVRKVGNPGSIRKNLINRWTLETIMKELKQYSKTNKSNNSNNKKKKNNNTKKASASASASGGGTCELSIQ